MRLVVVALCALGLLGGCSSMDVFETLSVVSEAYSIKQCREETSVTGDRWAEAACEDFDY